MSQKIIMYVVGALLVVGVGGYAVSNRNSPASEEGTATTATESKMSLKTLMGMSGSQKCTFTSSTSNSQSSGVVYLSGGKVRGDFSSVAAGKTIASHMITIDKTVYVWTDMMKDGFKMTMTDMEKQQAQAKASSQGQSVDVNAEMNYSCSKWSADASVFTLPSGIEFKDMTEMMKGMMGGASVKAGAGASTKSSQCGACDQAPENYRAQCRAAMGC